MTLKFWTWFLINRGQNEALVESTNAKQELSRQLAYSEERWSMIHASTLELVSERDRAKSEASLAVESREELAKMLEESSNEIEGLKTEITNSTNDLLRSQLEAEKLSAELEKSKAATDRSNLALEQEKAKHDVTKGQLIRNCQWIFLTHHMENPATTGIRGLLASGKRLSIILMLLLPLSMVAALPPPAVGNSWSTNRPPRAVEGLDNLSVTNLGSTTNWQFFNVGPKTVARLADVTNIASAFTGDAGGTNARQFGSLNLTNWSNIPTGAMANVVAANFLTNWANSISNYVTASTNSASVTNWINSRQPASANLTNWSLIPTGEMANVVSTMFLTNWANAVSNYVTAATNSASVTNWINSRQPASANLTNWSLIPTGAMANVVSTTFLTNWANAVSNYVTASTNSASVTNWINFRQPADSVLSNLVGTVARNVTNVVSLSTTNATSKPLTNAYANGVLTLFGVEQGSGHSITMNASNIVSANDWAQTASTTNVVGVSNWVNSVSNYVTAATNSASVTNWINFRQPASLNLTNWSLIPTGDMANVVSTTFLTNWANAISNLTQTKTALTTNANQFGAQVTLTIKEGELLTNVMAWPSNVTGPALIGNAKPGIGTNIFEFRNTNDQPVIFGATNNGVTLVASNVNFLGPQTNTSMLNVLGGVTNWAAVETRGNATNAGWLAIAGGFTNINGMLIGGSITNEGRMDTAGGVTNWIQSETKGTLYGSSNILVKAGQSTSNAWVGGLIFWSIDNFTNLNAANTLSNMGAVSVPAHTLTNLGDTIRADWGGVSKSTAANTNNFQIVYGSQVILDTGLQTASNFNFRAWVEITRSGGTAQHAEAGLDWQAGIGGATGLPFARTNVNLELVQTNGIATTLALKNAARALGAATNNSFRVHFDPASR